MEDHPIYRLGIRLSINHSDLSCVIVAEVENVKAAQAFLEQHSDDVDLILLDYFLPDGTGVDVIRYARAIGSKVKIILLSGDINNTEVVAHTYGYVDDYCGKDIDTDTLRTKLYAMFGIDDEEKQYRISIKAELSPREIEIIQLCANGLSAQEIADRLGLSRRTVEVHKSHIFEKLDLKNTADMVKYAYDAGLVR